MRIRVTDITIPRWSTIGYGKGTDEEGHEVAFIGDHRPMLDLGEALAGADEPPEVDLVSSQLISIRSFDAAREGSIR